ncbi:transcription factor SPEECHLESS-like [Senna tora]|uniref:Transcription factor SPEECHLESS-like n=1 Tax=Senna tora TaxID=362788 RepID=A0A834WH05_9FABA|nr:transcription factor SPEECHLESS-like [Senna tora]
MDDSFSDILDDKDFGGDDLFAILENLDDFTDFPAPIAGSKDNEETSRLVSQKSTSSSALQDSEETELEAASPKSKRQKLTRTTSSEEPNPDGQPRVSHITVERNRRKQMNEHLSVLRSLMPNFYVKRGDQASIIGGVVDYINELQQVLQSLEAKKQRKVYSEVLSPRLVSSPRPSSAPSPRKPPVSPRLSLPISPRTPQPGSPYKPRIPGQALKIISALEDLALEILHVSISTSDETMLNSFTIKIGIECQLSAEELAQQIQQTFC